MGKVIKAEFETINGVSIASMVVVLTFYSAIEKDIETDVPAESGIIPKDKIN